MAQVSVSLEPQHVKVVERYAKKMGIKAFSVALQSMIHQFDQQQKAEEAALAKPTTWDGKPRDPKVVGPDGRVVGFRPASDNDDAQPDPTPQAA